MVTIKDIAQRVGVSNQAVSAALNGRGTCRVSAARREAIRATAREMGYVCNSLARSMANGRNEVVAVAICGDTNAEFQQRLIHGILRALDERGFFMKLFNPRVEDSEKTLLQMRGQRVAGVLINAVDPVSLRPWLEQLREASLPCGVFNLANASGIGFGIATDDAAGVADAVRRMAELGHRRIAHVTFRDHPLPPYARNRLAGYEDGMRRFAPGYARVLEAGCDGYEGNRDRLRDLLAEPDATRPTALVCATDFFAAEVLRAAHAAGWRVPERLSVVGFGGLSLCDHATVPLATLAQPFHDMGYRATNLLLDAILDRRPVDGHNEVLPVVFRPGESCAPPA